MKNKYIYTVKILLLLATAFCTSVQAQNNNIKNDVFWNAQDGKPIYSQGGGVFQFVDPATGSKKYYWYGVHYQEADKYRQSPTAAIKTVTFESVTCYSSTDLVNWTAEGDVLTKDVVNRGGNKTWVGRLGVAYIKELQQYAMLVQHGNQVLITVSNTPTGPFKWHQRISMERMIGTSNTGDQTVFTDEENGKSYLIYSYGKGRNKLYVSEIGVKDGKVDLLDCTEIFHGESREGNCMFKYNKRYYFCASNIYGWDASFAYYLVADNIKGPYWPMREMLIMDGCEKDYAHITQTGFFYTIKGSEQETVVYCGDRWAEFAGNGLGYNQWCPLSFDARAPHFNSLSSWNLDIATGKWTVANDNNYVKNGSFEADRRNIPSNFKPVQQQLLGWETTVFEGNEIVPGNVASPMLNRFNSDSDRYFVIGEKSMNMTDVVPFKRKTSQIITSSVAVPLLDGLYTLTAKIKNSAGFAALEMFAKSSGSHINYSIKQENNTWQTITLTNIPVKKGKVEVGFFAVGAANAFCNVDDMVLVKN